MRPTRRRSARLWADRTCASCPSRPSSSRASLPCIGCGRCWCGNGRQQSMQCGAFSANSVLSRPRAFDGVEELRQRMSRTEPALLPDETREAIGVLVDHLDGLRERIDKIEARILAWHKASEASRRLASAPGVGPLTATAIVAAVGDGRQFKSARHFAAWLGLTPRIQASGGKEHIGRISKGGDRYLRTMLIHGARAVVGTAFRTDVRPKPWLLELLRPRAVNVAATAVAHKTARSLWAMLTRAELYRPRAAVMVAA